MDTGRYQLPHHQPGMVAGTEQIKNLDFDQDWSLEALGNSAAFDEDIDGISTESNTVAALINRIGFQGRTKTHVHIGVGVLICAVIVGCGDAGHTEKTGKTGDGVVQSTIPSEGEDSAPGAGTVNRDLNTPRNSEREQIMELLGALSDVLSDGERVASITPEPDLTPLSFSFRENDVQWTVVINPSGQWTNSRIIYVQPDSPDGPRRDLTHRARFPGAPELAASLAPDEANLFRKAKRAIRDGGRIVQGYEEFGIQYQYPGMEGHELSVLPISRQVDIRIMNPGANRTVRIKNATEHGWVILARRF